jgi:hypothetical protein
VLGDRIDLVYLEGHDAPVAGRQQFDLTGEKRSEPWGTTPRDRSCFGCPHHLALNG